MTPQSNTMSESALGSPAMPLTAPLHPTQPFLWSVRREIWENHAIYAAPLGTAALVLVGMLVSLRFLPTMIGNMDMASAAQHPEIFAGPFKLAASLIMGITFLVAFFYCLDSLYGERRDRSILFWKSLPVSDLTTVLSKATVPLLILPVVTFVVTLATQAIMLLIETVFLMHLGLNVHMLWSTVAFGPMTVMLLYHLFAIHALWYAPIYAWLMLVSSWAKRLPILWATLPIIALAALEKIAFNTVHVAQLLSYRINGAPGSAAFSAQGMPMGAALSHLEIGQFFTSTGLWTGLIFAVLCLAGAVQMRRYRAPL